MCYYPEFWEYQIDILDFERRSIAEDTKRKIHIARILSNVKHLLIRKLFITYPIFENDVLLGGAVSCQLLIVGGVVNCDLD